MHGIEVKDEKRPLDVQVIEQIFAKLKDMPALTKHGLVSASGFSESAVKKARHHGLELFHFRDWDGTGLKVDMRSLVAGAATFSAATWENVQPIPHLDDLPPEAWTQINISALVQN